MFEQYGMEFVLRNDIERFCVKASSITFHKKMGILSKIEIKVKEFHVHIFEGLHHLFSRK
jgi:hypothetical protein